MNKSSSQSEHASRPRRSRAEVEELVAAFERSGLNRTEYCRQHGLSLTSLKRYSKRLGDEGCGWSDQGARKAPAASLIPVEVVDRPAPDATGFTALYVELSGGRRIGVSAGFDAVTLRRLIAALGRV